MPQHHERKGEDKGREPGDAEGYPHFISYSLAATFLTREAGHEPHQKIKQIIEADEALELSSFLFAKQPRDPNNPPLARPWLIAIIGETPPEPIQRQFQEILQAGELTQLSLETIVTLADIRAQEARPGYREIQHGQGKRIPEAQIKFRKKPKGKGHRRR